MAEETAHTRGNYTFLSISAVRASPGGSNLEVGRLMGGLLGASADNPHGGVELKDIGRLTGMCPGCPGGTLCAPADYSPCPGNCGGGNMQDLQ